MLHITILSLVLLFLLTVAVPTVDNPLLERMIEVGVVCVTNTDLMNLTFSSLLYLVLK